MRHYDRFFEKKIKLISKNKKILDVGGGHPFQKYMAKYKSLFKMSSYETLDSGSYYKPTILGDIHKMPIEDSTYDAVICLSVLEHVADPKTAVKEIWRVMKRGGEGIFYVPSIYPYHARRGPGAYPDNYRFFDDGLKELFQDFSKLEICKCGGYFETFSFFLPFHSKIKWFTTPVAYVIDTILRTRKRQVTWGYYFYAKK